MVSLKNTISIWFAFLFFFMGSSHLIAEPKILASGSKGGSYSKISKELEGIIRNSQHAIPLKIRGTGGSLTNIKGINSGEFSFAIAQSNQVVDAINGKGAFVKIGPMKNIRIVANLFPEYVFLVVPKNSSIKSVSQLRGKHVGLGPAGSGTSEASVRILEAFGIHELEVKGHYIDTNYMIQRFKSGNLDAFFYVTSSPSIQLDKLNKEFPVSFISLIGPETKKFLKDYGFEEAVVNPLHDTASSPLHTLSVHAILIANKKLDQDVVYDLTRTIHESPTKTMRELKPLHENPTKITGELKPLHLSLAMNIRDPVLHPGAARCYQEMRMFKLAQAPITG